MNNFKSVHKKHILYIVNSTASLFQGLPYISNLKHPCLRALVEHFQSVEMKISMEIQVGIKSIVSSSKTPVGDGFGVQFLPFNFKWG